jgi:hypothetical protein
MIGVTLARPLLLMLRPVCQLGAEVAKIMVMAVGGKAAG